MDERTKSRIASPLSRPSPMTFLNLGPSQELVPHDPKSYCDRPPMHLNSLRNSVGWLVYLGMHRHQVRRRRL